MICARPTAAKWPARCCTPSTTTKPASPADTQRPKGVSLRTDCIGHGPFRPFVGELCLRPPLPSSAPPRTLTLPELIRDCNAYHLRQWQADRAFIPRRKQPGQGAASLAGQRGRPVCQLSARRLRPADAPCWCGWGAARGQKAKPCAANNIAKIKIMQKKGRASKRIKPHQNPVVCWRFIQQAKTGFMATGLGLAGAGPRARQPGAARLERKPPALAHANGTRPHPSWQNAGKSKARSKRAFANAPSVSARPPPQAQADALLSPRQRQVRDALAQLAAPPVHKNTGVARVCRADGNCCIKPPKARIGARTSASFWPTA